jgi:hypothetical protein
MPHLAKNGPPMIGNFPYEADEAVVAPEKTELL